MKKLIALSAVAAMATMSFASGPAGGDDLRAELEQLKKEVQELKKAQAKINLKHLKKQIREIKAHDAGDNIKWNVDFRTAYDVIGYKYADDTSDWNGIFSNRLWLGMAFAPTSNLVFKGLLSYYKAYGQLPAPQQGFNYFDWVVNETPNPAGEMRVKEAYWLYFGDSFLGADVPWTASFGRRPATDGFLANYREDQKPKSPLGHIINTEFDGASFKFNLENVTGVSGMYFKICMGRGMTNANVRYAGIKQNPDGTFSVTDMSGAEYTKVDGWSNTDLAGFIFVPYDDGQYSVHTTAFKAWNLPGMNMVGGTVKDMTPSQQAVASNNPNMIFGSMMQKMMTNTQMNTFKFAQVGDMYGGAISFLAQGIGDGISDFLDDTNFFISFAATKTMPNNYNYNYNLNVQPAFNKFMQDMQQAGYSQQQIQGMMQHLAQSNPQFAAMLQQMDTNHDGQPDNYNITMQGKNGMLGSNDNETGTSIYVGVNWPCQLISDARVGVEYNHGSKYWRSFTYAEDTLAGSKLATRGDAYEIWFNKQLIGKTLTAQIRYTYMDYKYTGSNAFFAQGGTPMTMDEARAMGLNPVDKAQDLRLYIRYRY